MLYYGMTEYKRVARKDWDWASAGEGFTHYQTKAAIHAALPAAGVDAHMEYELHRGTGYPLRIDVAVPSQQLAIEIRKGNWSYAGREACRYRVAAGSYTNRELRG